LEDYREQKMQREIEGLEMEREREEIEIRTQREKEIKYSKYLARQKEKINEHHTQKLEEGSTRR